jgi:predicted dehydrogenase
MGRRHIQAIDRLGWELVGVSDTSVESLRIAANERKLTDAQIFLNSGSMFVACEPDMVIISTNADTHCALTCEAAKQGSKFILVEKPMAVSLDECDRMIAACEAAGAKLAVNHQMRFMEQYNVPKAMFNSSAFGGLNSMTVVGGNFGFAMNGSHYFEAFRYLTEENIVEVSAWFSPEIVSNPRGPQYLDRAGCIRAVTASGKRFYMEIGADQGHGFGVTYACRLGLITVDELAGELSSSAREAQYRDLPTTRYGMPSENKRESLTTIDLVEITACVMRALVTGQNSVTGEVGRQVIELLVAAHLSAERGGVPVRLCDGGLDRHRVFPWA